MGVRPSNGDRMTGRSLATLEEDSKPQASLATTPPLPMSIASSPSPSESYKSHGSKLI